ncbi:MAG: helix-turn-helix domain-containing protein [Clostridium chrysemydis]|uniref:helix-turn-helix domain-containing protein n=1 Tax=Clostridium TaxID=1485 RepID=UPI00215376CE|nr:TetR/AcrR family transcriptional regulator [Clostridium sp. LY3-2]MCR6514279.1 TetR/AcrR family transcriptional regulator [Clostridium sp. LY3-2]
MIDSISNVFIDKINSDTEMTEKKKNILKVSVELFAKNGYLNTSTREIASLAKVAEGTIFKHFGSKENLLLNNIMPFMINNLVPEFALDFAKDKLKNNNLSFDSFIYSVVKDRINFINNNLQMFEILVKEVSYNSVIFNKFLDAAKANIYPPFNAILNKYREEDILVDLSNGDIIRFILTNIAGYSVSKILLKDLKEFNDEEEIKKICLVLTKGLKK